MIQLNKEWEKAHEERDAIVRRLESSIYVLYLMMFVTASKTMLKRDSKLSKLQLNKFKKDLIKEHDNLLKSVEVEIVKATLALNTLVSVTTINMLVKLYKGDKTAFRDKLDNLYLKDIEKASKRVLKGYIYQDGLSINQRLRKYSNKFRIDADTIIRRGIRNGSSSYDIAKELQRYIDPKNKKPWNWNKVYPGSQKVIDYNAQRLARTTANHVWQEAVKESCRQNPLVTKIEWRSALIHGRTCQLCKDRHGNQYLIDDLPQDHQMGLCTMLPVVDMSYKEIAEKLNELYGFD